MGFIFDICICYHYIRCIIGIGKGKILTRNNSEINFFLLFQILVCSIDLLFPQKQPAHKKADNNKESRNSGDNGPIELVSKS